MIQSIRPHHLFAIPIKSRDVVMRLPELHAPMTLESVVLLYLLKLVDPNAVFEFGTYYGIQTYNFAANIKEGSRVYTLDLDQAAFDRIESTMNAYDRTKAQGRFEHESRWAFKHTPLEKKITILQGNSRTYDLSSLYRSIDYIYIDGGHDYETITSDTENAFKMIHPEHPSCIIWHDYLNPNQPDVTTYLDQLSNRHPLFHVQSTRIVFLLAQVPDGVRTALG